MANEYVVGTAKIAEANLEVKVSDNRNYAIVSDKSRQH